jgi:extracellular matrix protein 14
VTLLRTRPEPLLRCAVILTDATLAMRSQILSFLPFLVVALICAPLQAFAVPSDTTQFAAAQRHQEQQPYNLRNVFPQLTWLRDTAIQKVFGLPPKTVKTGPEKPSSHPSSSRLPATLLAKYGGDVVLRFNLSTPAEEKALAEAADTLFLDVWEFTNNWADIRLREDDVGAYSRYYDQILIV